MTGQSLTVIVHAPKMARCVVRLLGAAALAAASLGATAPARADEFVDRVNGFFESIRQDRRSDPVILRALAAMEDPPAGLRDPERAALLPAGSSGWDAIAAWAAGDAQGAVLAAIHEVGRDPGEQRPMAFGQPYGLAELGSTAEQIELIQAGLYTDLGDPPLLSAAQHLYLERFDHAACLVHVEATRRASEGDAAGALELLADWIGFARQIADREFHEEKAWAFDAMDLAVRRIRDVVYGDFRAERTLDAPALKGAIDRIQDEQGPLSTDRIQLPRADFIGVEQLIATVMTARGRVRPEVFAPTMARLAATDRPLRLFGEAARWESVAESHVDWFAANDALASLRNDYAFRWQRDRTDPLLAQPYVVENFTASAGFRDAVAVVTRSLPDMRDLFTKRLLLRVETVGSRGALGLVGFYYETHAYPLDLSAIRPRYVRELEGDPFAQPSQGGRRPPLTFFVPIRDTKDRFSDRQTPPPHEISVLTPDAPNVMISLRDDQFVLYSVGPDGARQWAEEVQNTADAPAGRDYLLWPPVMSIVRDSLAQSGDFN
ncbi:MAG TPA: hypothetical protein VFF69_05995 [Phycisphaerales bacterium]|nr:hypothetical protein [Phycisphaerales bacterium]